MKHNINVLLLMLGTGLSLPQLSLAASTDATPESHRVTGAYTLKTSYYQGLDKKTNTVKFFLPKAKNSDRAYITVTLANGTVHVLHPTESASGAKYVDKKNSFSCWFKGDGAIIMKKTNNRPDPNDDRDDGWQIVDRWTHTKNQK